MQRKAFCGTLFEFAMFTVLVIAQPDSHAQTSTGFTKHYHTYHNTTIPYYTFVPMIYDTAQALPVMLCMHGAGERGDDSTIVWGGNTMAMVWRYPTEQTTCPCIVVVPQCPLYAWWSDSEMLSTLADLLDSLQADIPFDTNRIYVTGFSMGGQGTWDLATRFPRRFAAILPISGRGDESQAFAIRRLPIWAFHGAEDPIVSVTGTRRMIFAIARSGINAVQTIGLSDSALALEVRTGASLLYTEYPSAGHGVSYWSYQHPLLVPWVFSQSKATAALQTYTREVETWPLTARAGKDTVSIRAHVDNPVGHSLSVTAQIVDAVTGSTYDSLQLRDDGLHGDGLTNDGVWGSALVPAIEGMYVVNVRAFDPAAVRPSLLANTSFFATGGPIGVERVEVATPDTIVNPGDALRYRVYLKNKGSNYTARNITATVSCSDTSVSMISNSIPYGDIAPGQTSPGTGLQTVRFSATRPGNYVVPFTVKISSCGVQFWTDYFSDEVTGVSQPRETLPKSYALLQNYPNPFNPTTVIRSQLPAASNVKLVIYDLLGRELGVLVDERRSAGTFEDTFDARALTSGIYFYKLAAGNFVQTRKMVVVK